ncbi:MAG TPA: DUF1549 domain-containing protein, partial [Tepidisphaeraceae bacterium]|nr:DUF1549 domain-containing protein [Tepidisphaeraceae bacterium]
MDQILSKLSFAAALLVSVAFTASAAEVPANAPLPDKIQFNRDIQPILASNCYQCHGPDSGQRKADLRLDTKDGLFSLIKNDHPVVPGDPQHSELFRRITTDNVDDRMPEPKSGRRLAPRQIALIKKWIEQGAAWQGHWAFTAPVRPPLPDVKDASWVRNPIDRFVLSHLEAEGVKPSPAADKATLIRRVTLDLTGLPPTPQEIDAFLADKSPDAYEKVVDRLLADPHYGERMTLDWLDAARFADTHGYHIDSGRDMTHWRDWVIKAYNTNKPFDQFAVEQLAGDLLPNATVDQKIASGFNRNSMINFEGGAIPQEYLTQYLIDRVDTTSTVFLGLTLRCCQCHDHKYDPFTQKDFYSMYAFFNAMPENGLDGQKGNAVPVLQLPSKEQQAKLAEFDSSISRIEKELTAPNPELDEAQAKWEKSFSGSEKPQWTVVNPQAIEPKGGATFDRLDDHSIAVTGNNPDTDVYTITLKTSLASVTGLRLEALPAEKLADGGPGRSANGNFVLTGVHVQSGMDAGELHPVRLSAAEADFSQDKFPIESLLKGGLKAGWAIFPKIGERHTAAFQFDRPVDANDSTVLKVRLEFRSQFAKHQIGRFRIALTSSPMPVRSKAPADLAKIIATPAGQRTKEQADQLREYFRTTYAPQVRDPVAELKKVRDE